MPCGQQLVEATNLRQSKIEQGPVKTGAISWKFFVVDEIVIDNVNHIIQWYSKCSRVLYTCFLYFIFVDIILVGPHVILLCRWC